MEFRSISGAVLAMMLFTGNAVAQDDVPWWRGLFGQSGEQESLTPDPVEGDHEAEPSAEGAEPGENAIPDEENPEAFIAQEIPLGSVHWNVPLAILELDTLKRKSGDVRIPGFRIQLFMGRLDSARSLRNQLMEDQVLPFELHLAPYPPLFGLQVGDFRSSLSAYRARRSLLGRFPDALVVPAQLTPEEAFPSPSNCVRTP